MTKDEVIAELKDMDCNCQRYEDAMNEAIRLLEEKEPLALSASSCGQRQFSEAEMREAFEAGCLITNITKTVAQAEREFAVWMQKWLSKVKVIER